MGLVTAEIEWGKGKQSATAAEMHACMGLFYLLCEYIVLLLKNTTPFSIVYCYFLLDELQQEVHIFLGNVEKNVASKKLVKF